MDYCLESILKEKKVASISLSSSDLSWVVDYSDGGREWSGYNQLDNSLLSNVVDMDSRKIYYSNTSISDTFSCGTPIVETVKELADGKIIPDDLPAMRVVRVDGSWHSLDNRR